MVFDLNATAAAVLLLGSDVARVAALVERGGAPEMLATCALAETLVKRIGTWLDEQRAAPTQVSDGLLQCLERLPPLVEIFGDVRAHLDGMHERRQLADVAELADVFESIRETLEHLEREVPCRN